MGDPFAGEQALRLRLIFSSPVSAVSDQPTEGERKLRAALRALMSSGVWVLIAIHVASVLPVRLGLFGEATGEVIWPRAFWGGFLLAAVLFVEAGLFTALARSREAVTAREVFQAAAAVFPRFLWLILKMVGFSMLIVLTVLVMMSMVLVMLGQGDVETIRPQLEQPVKFLQLLLPALLVWWLPWVFTRQQFRLLTSLGSALRLLVREPGRTAYVILLALTPAALLMVWADQLNPWLLTPIEMLGLLCVWSANIYCVEWLRDRPEA